MPKKRRQRQGGNPGAAQAAPRPTAAVRREAQRQARISGARRQQRQVWMWVAGGVAAIIALIVALVVINLGGGGEPGQRIAQRIADMGRQHIAQGQTFTGYNSDPPTSGPHWPSPAPRTFSSSQTIPDEQLIHSLEHGYVVIHVNCNSSQCPQLYDQLDDIYARYDAKVIVNYRPRTKSRIALAAWTRLDGMEEFDEQRVLAFIKAYRGKIGPEPNAP